MGSLLTISGEDKVSYEIDQKYDYWLFEAFCRDIRNHDLGFPIEETSNVLYEQLWFFWEGYEHRLFRILRNYAEVEYKRCGWNVSK